MMRFYFDEEWKEIPLAAKIRHRYAVSNYGRIIAFKNEFQDGHFLNGGNVEGFKLFCYRYKENGTTKAKGHLFHKLVAEYFLPPKKEGQIYLLHLDHNKQNNHTSNLKWATLQEWMDHNKENPNLIAAIQKSKQYKTKHRFKLTEAKVQLLKQKIFDPNRKTRLKMLAKQFGITEMQLWRIKSGENWGRITVNGYESPEEKVITKE